MQSFCIEMYKNNCNFWVNARWSRQRVRKEFDFVVSFVEIFLSNSRQRDFQLQQRQQPTWSQATFQHQQNTISVCIVLIERPLVTENTQCLTPSQSCCFLFPFFFFCGSRCRWNMTFIWALNEWPDKVSRLWWGFWGNSILHRILMRARRSRGKN